MYVSNGFPEEITGNYVFRIFGSFVVSAYDLFNAWFHTDMEGLSGFTPDIPDVIAVYVAFSEVRHVDEAIPLV